MNTRTIAKGILWSMPLMAAMAACLWVWLLWGVIDDYKTLTRRVTEIERHCEDNLQKEQALMEYLKIEFKDKGAE